MSNEKRTPIGGGSKEIDKSPINFYYQYEPPKTPHAKVKTLAVGASIIGTFEHSFVSKEYKNNDGSPKIDSHIIRTEKEGKVTLKGCTMLNNAVAKLQKGVVYEFVYEGKGKKAPGKKPPFVVKVYPVAGSEKKEERVAIQDDDLSIPGF